MITRIISLFIARVLDRGIDGLIAKFQKIERQLEAYIDRQNDVVVLTDKALEDARARFNDTVANLSLDSDRAEERAFKASKLLSKVRKVLD
ncbi:MAG: hypothetical protein EAZ84_00325 [Verrucomicrobia bacterium]|nr:MAG: hypothetical protein EAZ84_00325 [Verrucomicrobiota bacterium]